MSRLARTGLWYAEDRALCALIHFASRAHTKITSTCSPERFSVPYVMVPVPEEHVEAVMNFVLRSVAQAALQDWDDESLTKLWNESDEATRSLLSFTARAAASGNEIEVAEVARQMQLTPRE